VLPIVFNSIVKSLVDLFCWLNLFEGSVLSSSFWSLIGSMCSSLVVSDGLGVLEASSFPLYLIIRSQCWPSLIRAPNSWFTSICQLWWVDCILSCRHRVVIQQLVSVSTGQRLSWIPLWELCLSLRNNSEAISGRWCRFDDNFESWLSQRCGRLSSHLDINLASISCWGFLIAFCTKFSD
jgi:hypothetical protein